MGYYVHGHYIPPLSERNRRVKQAQGWRCATCGAQAGGRDAHGHIVVLAVVRAADGTARALCQECRHG
jgi:hypothetical protein